MTMENLSFLPKRRQLSVLSLVLSVAALGFLLFLPMVSALKAGATLTGMFEESLGYRYFYSLRAFAGEKGPFYLPQGQLQDLIGRGIHFAFHISGIPLYETGTGRIDDFGYSLVALALTLAVFGFAFSNRKDSIFMLPMAATAWGSIFYLPRHNTFVALLQPDYLPYILPIGIVAAALTDWLLRTRSPSAWSHALVLGAFFGICLSTKVTLVLFAVSVFFTGAIVSFRPKGFAILALAGLIGLLFWGVVIMIDYGGGIRGLTRYVDFLSQFLQTAGDVAPQTSSFWKWGANKLRWETYLHAALVLTPFVALLTAVLSLISRRIPATSLPVMTAAIGYLIVLYQRDYPGTNLEVAVYVSFAFIILWREAALAFSGRIAGIILGGGQLVVIMTMFRMDLGFYRSVWVPSVEMMTENARAQNRLHEALAALPRPQLWLVPTNDIRPLSVESAVMKGGGSSNSNFDASKSRIIADISPTTDYLVGAARGNWHPRWPLSAYPTILFATYQPTDEEAILGMQAVTGLDLASMNCNLLTDMRFQRIIFCRQP